MKKSTDVARQVAWAVAALLLVPGVGRAAGLGEGDNCQREQAAQQRSAQPPATPLKGDKPGEKGQDHPPRPKWWIDPKLRAELGITDPQSVAVDKVWQKTMPSLIEGRQKLEKLEDALSQMTDVADEAAVIAQIDRVENLRADLSKGRTLMIYRMNKLLTLEQRAKVKAMYPRPDQGRRGPGPR
jgi:Spy/CpxP family protein refolding chaperone